MSTNVQQLTHAHAVVKAKARARKNQIEQISFDEDARRSVRPTSALLAS